MKNVAEPISGLYVVEPTVHGDNRGWFMESFTKKFWQDLNVNCEFVQDNRSFSRFGTLRGLHFQKGEAAQAKLVTCLRGKVLDVAVDLRPNSLSRGKFFSQVLSDENKLQMYVPRGFAHGFVVLSEEAEFFYRCDNYYNPAMESGVIFNDQDLKIDWMVKPGEIILSEKDKHLLSLKDILKQDIWR